MSVTEDNDNIVVVCRFALGTDAQGFLVDIQTDNRTVLSRNVSLFQCVGEISNTSAHSQPCSLETSFYKPELLQFGNYTLSVYNWEKDGSINIVKAKHLKVSTSNDTTPGTTDAETETNTQIVTGILIICEIGLSKNLLLAVNNNDTVTDLQLRRPVVRGSIRAQ